MNGTFLLTDFGETKTFVSHKQITKNTHNQPMKNQAKSQIVHLYSKK